MAAAVTFLGAEWLAEFRDACAELPEIPGASGVVQTAVTGAPGGDVTYWTAYADGRVVDSGLGEHLDATVVFTAPYRVAVAVATGEVEPSVAFMRGSMKVAGDQAALLRLLAVTATPAYRAATAALAERTAVPAPAGR